VRRAVAALPEERAAGGCACGTALTHALLTDRTQVPAATIDKLRPLLGRVWPA
jgi:hypothetical protein